MRRVVAVLGALAASGTIAATVAIAATHAIASTHAAHNASFSGSGADYLNKGKTWSKGATGKFSFKTNSAGNRIIDFSGSYTYSCGGTASITAKFVTITSNGRFNYPFTDHLETGTFYAEIYGAFLDGGRKASVNYLIDFVAKGKKVSHPYDTRHPQSLGCASWVRGVATAR
jgi:hypothetical protein